MVSIQQRIYSVSQLAREARIHIESGFGQIWLEGEISNLAQPASGHIYFSLKDTGAQVRCAWFRNRRQGPALRLQDGMQVLVLAEVSLYENRTEFQLLISRVEAIGDGLLQRQFEQLKQRLQAEGLFADQHKQPIPTHPQTIGVVTSATGAALRDVLQVLQRRAPQIPVIIYPARVQGDEARQDLIQALHKAGQRREVDLLLLVRGGGSLEDLAVFNDETLARAIHHCPIPLITGIGHEIDFTIADFVADLRAPTPSAAAELASCDRQELLQQCVGLIRRLRQRVELVVQQRANLLAQLVRRLQAQQPRRRLQQHSQSCDELELRLRRTMVRLQQQRGLRFKYCLQRWHAVHPQRQLIQWQLAVQLFAERLQRAVTARQQSHQAKLSELARALDAVSPLATMARGYAILSTTEQTVLTRVADTHPGARLQARLQDGYLDCLVERRVIDRHKTQTNFTEG